MQPLSSSSNNFPPSVLPKEEIPQIPLTPVESAMYNTACKAYAILWFQWVQMIKILKQAQSSEKGAMGFNWKWLNPFTLFRGISITLCNAPLFGLMGAVNDQFTKHLEKEKGRTLTQPEKASVAIFAGVMGAVPWTTLDLMIVQNQWQNRHVIPPKADLRALGRHILALDMKGVAREFVRQKELRRETLAKKISPAAIFMDIWSKRGFKGLMRGLPETVGREVPFITALLWAGPEAEKIIRPRLPEEWTEKTQKNMAKVLSGIAVGFLVTLWTQAVDVTKTVKQQRHDPAAEPEFRTTRSTVKFLWNKGSETALKAYLDPAEKLHWASRILPRSLSAKTVRHLGGIAALNVGLIPRMGVLVLASIGIMHGREMFGAEIQRHKRKQITPGAPAP